MKTAAEIFRDWNYSEELLVDAIDRAINEAMEEQKKACEQAVMALENPYREFIAKRNKYTGRKLENNPAREQENLMRSVFDGAKENAIHAVVFAEVKK